MEIQITIIEMRNSLKGLKSRSGQKKESATMNFLFGNQLRLSNLGKRKEKE